MRDQTGAGDGEAGGGDTPPDKGDRKTVSSLRDPSRRDPSGRGKRKPGRLGSHHLDHGTHGTHGTHGGKHGGVHGGIHGGQRGRHRERARFLSPLTRRILMVNIIALVIPIGGLLYLGPYRDNLIRAEMEALRAQGEIFAGALGEGAIAITTAGQEVLSPASARHIIRRLSGPSGLRARLFLQDGELAIDSRRLGAARSSVQVEELAPPETMDDVINPILDMLDRLTMVFGENLMERYVEDDTPAAEDYPEVARALQGDIMGVVRETEHGRLILSVALPVQRYYKVFGSLMLSKSGKEVEAALRNVRATILMVFAGALLITVALSIYLAGAIARPLNKLAAAADRVARSVGRQEEEIPDMTDRADEIGDLSGVLREMTQALRLRLVAIERFAADVSHEIKNPLTSLRSAVETVSRVSDEDQRRRLLEVINDDVERLDRLISDISDASRLDAELSRTEAEPLDLAGLLATLAGMYGVVGTEDAPGRPRVTMEAHGEGPFQVMGNEDRLVQVFRNLIGNAMTFSPKDGRIDLKIRRDGDIIEAAVEDEGPGIPPNKLEAIFDRFYTERPEGEKFGAHSGLGLSISKQIMEAHAGEIRAENRMTHDGKPRGARFIVRLPAA